ncbi:uncharacterized protein LOC144505058 isoform X2 [Mustelus asterias]
MTTGWNPSLPEGKPQNSLAAKGFRSVRPKFLTSGRKSPVQFQPSIHNGMEDIRENSHNARTKETFSSVLPNRDAFSLMTQSNIPYNIETENLSSTLGPNHNVPSTTERESPVSSVSATYQILYNVQVDNSRSSADPGHLHNDETELQVPENIPSDSENELDPVYKTNLRTVSEKMNVVFRSSPIALLTSESKRSPPLIAKKVSVEEGSKAWYKSMFKNDYSVLKAENYGMSSNVDARMKQWEPDSTKQQPLSCSATDYRSRSQLTGPLPCSSTTKDNCTIKGPLLPGPLSSSDSENRKCNPQSQCLHPNISDSKSDQSCTISLSADLRDTLSRNCTAPPSVCQPTKPGEVPCNSLAAKDPHSCPFTKATGEESNWLHTNDKVDACGYRVKPRSVFDYEPGKSSALDHDYPISIQSTTSGSVLRSKTRSLPTLAESTSQPTINNTGQQNGLEIDPSHLNFLEIQHFLSADQISIDSKNEELADALPDVNQSFQSRKPEELCDPRQQLKMELTVRVKYDFQGQTSKELPVRKGDIVFVHRQRDHNWYEGKCNGKSGLIPICYVEPFSEPQPHKQEVLDEVAVAKFRFTALTNIELPLEKDQTVVLLRRIDENWYEGKYPGTNRKGIFPVTYVEIIGKPPDEPVFHQDLPTSGSDLKIKMASQRPFQQFHPDESYENVQTGEEMYLVLYSFAPNKDDELELRQGDLVNVIKKCGDGWYLGIE